MEEQTKEIMNRFLQYLFNGNAVIDNICYNLKYRNYARIEGAIHGPVAHVMGVWADEVSDLMDELGARPIRYSLPDNIEDMDPQSCLEKLVAYFDGLRSNVAKAIDASEEAGDLEVKLFFENFMTEKIVKYRKQAIQWRDAIKTIGADSLNVHIEDYTSYIK